MKRRKYAYQGFYNVYVKRWLDVAISGAALCFLWPLFPIIGAARLDLHRMMQVF